MLAIVSVTAVVAVRQRDLWLAFTIHCDRQTQARDKTKANTYVTTLPYAITRRHDETVTAGVPIGATRKELQGNKGSKMHKQEGVAAHRSTYTRTIGKQASSSNFRSNIRSWLGKIATSQPASVLSARSASRLLPLALPFFHTILTSSLSNRPTSTTTQSRLPPLKSARQR